MQIMYGVRGERRLEEYEVPWLSGYADSKPVRVGNAASKQFQLDVYGEVMDALHQAREFRLEPQSPSDPIGLDTFSGSSSTRCPAGIKRHRNGLSGSTRNRLKIVSAQIRALGSARANAKRTF